MILRLHTFAPAFLRVFAPSREAKKIAPEGNALKFDEVVYRLTRSREGAKKGKKGRAVWEKDIDVLRSKWSFSE